MAKNKKKQEYQAFDLEQLFSKCILGKAASASPRNLLEMHILGPTPDLPNLITGVRGSGVCVLS